VKKPPTLADAVIREWTKPIYRRIDPNNWLANNIASARKFSLDDAMSGFLADLAYASLLATHTKAKASLLLDGLRVQARLPHKLTFIEFNKQAQAERAHSEYGATVDIRHGRLPDRSGWLCMQHPQIETAFMAINCSSHAWDAEKGRLDTPQGAPIAYQWRCDPGPLLFPTIEDDEILMANVPREYMAGILLPKKEEGLAVKMDVSSWLLGVSCYASDSVGVAWPPHLPIEFVKKYHRESKYRVLSEFSSDLRYLWALLATINNLPVSFSDVRPSKGYLTRSGRHKNFVEHRVVHLTIPTKRYKRIAQQAIAISRRKGHEVRGHLRLDWRKPLSALCFHDFVADKTGHTCKRCKGRQIWIDEHLRGDSSLGFVTHEYSVEKQEA
jgi:hypothetical protein